MEEGVYVAGKDGERQKKLIIQEINGDTNHIVKLNESPASQSFTVLKNK
jgi:hypothetical protein